ncbi:hypothetical protein EDB83DRAFT_2329677, partial [Lactarius deliciosus]
MYGTSAPNGRQSAASPRPPQSLALWYGCGFSAGLLPPGAPYFLSFYISVSFSSYTTCTLSVVREGWDAHNVHVFTWQDQVQYSAHARRIHLPAKQGVFVESWSNTVVIQVASLSPKVLYDGHQYRAPYLRVGHQHLRAQDPWMTDCPCRSALPYPLLLSYSSRLIGHCDAA